MEVGGGYLCLYPASYGRRSRNWQRCSLTGELEGSQHVASMPCSIFSALAFCANQVGGMGGRCGAGRRREGIAFPANVWTWWQHFALAGCWRWQLDLYGGGRLALSLQEHGQSSRLHGGNACCEWRRRLSRGGEPSGRSITGRTTMEVGGGGRLM